jgi:hypothetical protein
VDSITFEILDEKGDLINTFKGVKKQPKSDNDQPRWMRGGSSVPTTAKGLNSFNWDLRYPGATSFDGMIIWSGRPQVGPLAPTGDYQAKITVGENSHTVNFKVVMDPNLTRITASDVQAQFDLAMKIKNNTSIANETVIAIRSIRTQLEEVTNVNNNNNVKELATDIVRKITIIEEDLYQVKNQSNQDPLNFPIKLNNRLASLRRSVETGQAKPTDAAYNVFDELSLELTTQLKKFDAVITNEGARLNELIVAQGETVINWK